jgi:hypothetical protein
MQSGRAAPNTAASTSRSPSARAVAGSVATTLLAFLLVSGAGRAFAADPDPTITIANGEVAGLVAALSAADTNGVPDVIALAAGGTYTLTEPVAGGAGMGLPPVQGDSSPVTIEGNGATIQRSSIAGTPACSGWRARSPWTTRRRRKRSTT